MIAAIVETICWPVFVLVVSALIFVEVIKRGKEKS